MECFHSKEEIIYQEQVCASLNTTNRPLIIFNTAFFDCWCCWLIFFVSGNTLCYSISSHIFQNQPGLSQHSVKMQIHTTNVHTTLSAQEAQKAFHTTECYGLTQHTLLQVAWTPGIQTRDRQICSASDAWWWSQSSCRERETRLMRSLRSYTRHRGWETRVFVYQLFLGWHPQNEMFFIWKKWLHLSYWKWRKKNKDEKAFF